MFISLACGFLMWLGGTVVIRTFGQHLLKPESPASVLLLYGVSFLAMALLTVRLFRLLHVDSIEGVTLLALPTLLLDPFACLFFPVAFPNVTPAAAGIFGGWMLICCAGAVTGAWIGR